MPRVALTYLERRPSGYYFRRRIPALPGPAAEAEKKFQNSARFRFMCFSLRTQFLPEAKRLARRLTAASDALFAARTEQDMPISAETMVAILKTLRDQEIRGHERARARATARSIEDVAKAQAREQAIQDALRSAVALGLRDTALPLLATAASRLGLALDPADPDLQVLAHHATRLLIEISEERARREAGDYGAASVLAELCGPAAAVPAAAETPMFRSLRAAPPHDVLKGAFGGGADVSLPGLGEDARGFAPMAAPAAVPQVGPQGLAAVPFASPSVPQPASLRADGPGEVVKPPVSTRLSLPELRIDTSVLSDSARALLCDPWTMRIDEAFGIYFEVKKAGYGDEFTKSQKRRPNAGANWVRNSQPGLDVARRFWVDLLGNCRLSEVTDRMLEEALEKLWRLPKLHGKKFKNVTGFYDLIDAVDSLEIQQEAEVERLIDTSHDLSEGQIEKLRRDAAIPRIRSETYLKHGRAMGRIGRFLEGLGLLPRNPFARCSWSADEEKQLQAQEEARARIAWDDRIHDLFRTPEFQGKASDPGSPLFWAPLIAVHNGLRMQEVLQIETEDFGVEDGHPYLAVRNKAGNFVKSSSAERRLPLHPNLIALGLMDLVAMRQREKEPRLFPDLGRGEAKGTHAELFTKAFGYYRKTNGVYWPGLDFHAFRTTFHSYLMSSRTVSDARRRRLMGHTPVDEGEKSYAQSLRSSSLIEDIREVKIDISMIRSPIRHSADKVVSLHGTRLRQAAG